MDFVDEETENPQITTTEYAFQNHNAETEKLQRLYEAVTGNTPDLIYILDLDYRFTYANRALLIMWGKTWEEAIGNNLLENGYEPWHASLHEREIDEDGSAGGCARKAGGDQPHTDHREAGDDADQDRYSQWPLAAEAQELRRQER